MSSSRSVAQWIGLTCFVAQIGCVTDARYGPDSGRMDGGRDAGAPVCTGEPPSCATLEPIACTLVEGCALTQCAGSPIACGELRGEIECRSSAGCAWTGSCTGTPMPCSTITSQNACAAQIGCGWSLSASCDGSAAPCELRSEASCRAQPGCRIAATRDGGVDASMPRECERDGGPACSTPSRVTVTGCNSASGLECDGDWNGYCSPACSAGECCVPRDGSFECAPRTASGCPAPDIFVDGTQIEGRYTIDETYFPSGSCEIAEGCVNAPGTRRLLRFSTFTPNIGGADLFIGAVPSPGVSNDFFVWSSCHGHHHFESYAHYELLSEDGCCVTVTGRKQAFCLEDFQRYDTSVGSSSMQYNCDYQGIQRGWQDVYYSGLPCQWIDITDVAPGNYVLRIQLNTEHVLLESNYDNNEVRIPVTIP